MIALYAGSFDPITVGHQDIIERASGMFDSVIVAIGVNSTKTPFLPLDLREELIRSVIHHLPNVKVMDFQGLLGEFAMRCEAHVLVRGLRAVTDFEAELGMAHANAQLFPLLETVFLATSPEYSFVSSSTVREINRHHGDISYYVHPEVEKTLIKRRPPKLQIPSLRSLL